MIEYIVQAALAGVHLGLHHGAYKIIAQGNLKSGLISTAGVVAVFASTYFIDNYFGLGLVSQYLSGSKQKVINITSIVEEIERYMAVEFNQTLVEELKKQGENKLQFHMKMLIESVLVIFNSEFLV